MPRKDQATPRGRLSRFTDKQGRRLDPVALVAAAVAATTGKQSDNGQQGQAAAVMPSQQWQRRVLGYYDMLPECRNPAQFVSTAVSKMRFYPAVLDDDGQPQEIQPGDPGADLLIPLVNALDSAAEAWARLTWLVGEGRLCQSRPPDSAKTLPVVWEFLSADEIKLTDRNRRIIRSPYGQGTKIEYQNITDDQAGAEPEPGQMRTWRFWIPHPNASELADSPVRPITDLYEQLWWLTMSERADLQSRIADNGILVIPSEIGAMHQKPAGVEADTTPEDTEDGGFLEELGESMLEAISDPGTAAAAVPPALEGPYAYLDRVFMLHTHEGSQSLVFVSAREAALIKRIADGLPLPAEAMLGLSGVNHWTAWKVEDEKWQQVEPWVTLYCRDATNVVLRPFLAANQLPENIIVAYDPSGLVSDPDRGSTALALNKQGLLGNVATLNANGWGEDDMMEGEELDWWRAIQLRDATIATGEPAPAAAPVAGDPAEQPPAEEDGAGQDNPDATASNQMKRWAVEFANTRARQAAGASLRGRKRSCPDCLEGLENVENDALLGSLDGEKLARLGVRPTKLVEQMTAAFAGTLHELGYRVAALDRAAVWFTETLHGPERPTDEILDVIERRNGDGNQ